MFAPHSSSLPRVMMKAPRYKSNYKLQLCIFDFEVCSLETENFKIEFNLSWIDADLNFISYSNLIKWLLIGTKLLDHQLALRSIKFNLEIWVTYLWLKLLRLNVFIQLAICLYYQIRLNLNCTCLTNSQTQKKIQTSVIIKNFLILEHTKHFQHQPLIMFVNVSNVLSAHTVQARILVGLLDLG